MAVEEGKGATFAPAMDAMGLKTSKPPVVHVLDDGGFVDDPPGTSRLGGERERPILLDLLSGPRLWRRKRSVPVDEEVQLVEDVKGESRGPGSRISRRGGDRNHPISVEEYAMPIRSRRTPDVVILEGFEGFQLDPKGKEPIGTLHRREKRRNSLAKPLVIEIGQSSRSAPAKPDAYCGICMEEKFHYECISSMGCSHMYCNGCVSQYVAAKVEENEVLIKCPDPSCKVGFLEPEMCRVILPPEVFDRWGSKLSEAMILETMKFYCPFKDCSALLIDERGINGEVITDAECPHCSRMFCAQCKVPWHAEVTCTEYQRLGADERGQEDLMLRKMAKSKHWQRCPKCKFYVERIEGCNFIMCRCRHTFCYRCAGPMGVNHFCTQCRR